jgi:ribosomal protein S18 acetylase RimI-like enzyme/predicted double-glycine peptidase
MPRRDKIRLATEKDLSALTELEELTFDSDRFTRDQIEYLLTRSRATTFIIEQGQTLVGAACILWRKAHHGARLYNIAIHPAFQGKKHGDRLLKECEIEAARRGCRIFTLEVYQENRHALRLFEKNGYAITRNLPDYYGAGFPGFKMSKELNIKIPTKIRLNIPYRAQTLDFTCGPACMMMALKYFLPDMEPTRSLEMNLWKEGTPIFMASGYAGTDGYGLSLSAVKRGLKSRLIMSMEKTPMLKSVRNLQKREIMRILHNNMKRDARKAGVSSAIYEYGIEEIVSAIHRGMIPIVMISTYRLTGDRVPHWVVVTGFDEDNVYIHDPDLASYKRNKSRARHLRIEKSEFLRMSRYGKEVYRCLILIGK